MDEGGVPTQQTQQTQQARPGPGGEATAGGDAERRFVAQVLGDTELVWKAQFRQLGRPYQDPVLVLFNGAVQSGCGAAQSQVGPFYCPNDQRIYIDLGFMAQLQRQLGANGDFAAAYIVAHEVGHHVQQQLGILDLTRSLQQQAGELTEANAIQVRVELQADCFAGLWAVQADQARAILEKGDVEEGLNAAAAVGDDRLQRRAQGGAARELHPWLLAGPGALVPHRAGARRAGRLRHLRGPALTPPALTPAGAWWPMLPPHAGCRLSP
ncbi:KPN_02809 family neutral zinc metallopeptidase [Teichococcus aestuarii]